MKHLYAPIGLVYLPGMTGSVTQLFRQFKLGDEDATADLFNRLLPRIRGQISRSTRNLRVHDEDDIAVNAFYEFCKAVQECRCEEIHDRSQLWQVLCVIAIRQVNDSRKYETAQMRGGDVTTVSLANWHSQLPEVNQRPDVQLELMEQCQYLLESLSDSELRRVAELKLFGFTNLEIADKMQVSKRTIQYMLNRVKDQLTTTLGSGLHRS